jgi:prephenate dehydrogenase
MKKLRKISVLGMGLLGASISSAILRSVSGVKSVGFSHRASTRDKARGLGVADEIVETMDQCVSDADVVILATPICTFENLFKEMAEYLRPGTIVTDVGSTKTLPHKWAQKYLPKTVHYVGSHPIAGSEQRGVEFARDDLLFGATCIVTRTAKTNVAAFRKVKKLWSDLGCNVKVMTPNEHDKIFADVSHVPHVTAAALVNATSEKHINYAGTGFVDTSRISSGPENVWADILLTNSANSARGIARVIKQLEKLKAAITAKDEKKIAKLLGQARSKRAALIKHKMKSKELL